MSIADAVEGARRTPTREPTSENFPVASIFLRRRHRAVILAFYAFARHADDIADDGAMPGERQRRLLNEMRATLAGENDGEPRALTLRGALAARGLSPVHGLELLRAFTQDTEKRRYADWADLLDYCRYSASPVGRFVLDVHGEDRALWPRSDALCTALQIINHTQDCALDLKRMDRVYMPIEDLEAAGARVEDLSAPAASPALRKALLAICAKTQNLLNQSRGFAADVRDRRLALEIDIIQRLADDLNTRLMRRDPLSERVHHSKWESAAIALGALLRPRSAP